MKILGQFLLWAGFLSGALATVFQVKSSLNPWLTINWYWFAASIVVGVVGIVIFRKSKTSTASGEDQATLDYAILGPTVERISDSVQELRKGLGKLPPSKITQQIDESCAEHFNRFIEARQSIADEKGLAVYASVMTEFAAAERAVNRAWSAAADGYLDEVESCLDRALVLLGNARQQL